MKELKEYEVDSNGKILDSDFYKATLIKFWPEFDHIVSTGVIDYLDENGKIVMFGTSKNDTRIETKAINFDFNEDIKTQIKTYNIDIPFGILNHYKDHIKNGITYVGGAGDDRIIGTDYDDILYGYDKYGKGDETSRASHHTSNSLGKYY